jgi:hypothetical protein
MCVYAAWTASTRPRAPTRLLYTSVGVGVSVCVDVCVCVCVDVCVCVCGCVLTPFPPTVVARRHDTSAPHHTPRTTHCTHTHDAGRDDTPPQDNPRTCVGRREVTPRRRRRIRRIRRRRRRRRRRRVEKIPRVVSYHTRWLEGRHTENRCGLD